VADTHEPDGADTAYTVVSVAVSPDGTPLFGFETDPGSAGEPLEFDFLLVQQGLEAYFAVRTGEHVVAVARDEGARTLCRRLVEYEEYDVGVRYDTQSPPSRGDPADPRAGFHEVTRHRLSGAAYDRLYERYRELG
jgi:hypothetical protein